MECVCLHDAHGEDDVHMIKEENKGYLLIFAAGCIWGTIGVFVTKLSEFGSTPALTGLLRMIFAFLILATLTISKFGIQALKIDRKTLLFCMILGLVNQGIYNALYSFAITEVGISISAVLLNSGPVFTAIASVLVFSEKITRVKALGLIINISGCILAATGGRFDAVNLSLIGLLCGVGASFCYAMTPIIGRLASGKANAFVVSTYSFLFGAIFLAVMLQPWKTTILLNQNILITGFLYALIPTALAYLLYYPGLQRIKESSKVPIIASMETVVATLLGVLLFHENIRFLNYLGIFLVLFSVVVINLKISPRSSRP